MALEKPVTLIRQQRCFHKLPLPPLPPKCLLLTSHGTELFPTSYSELKGHLKAQYSYLAQKHNTWFTLLLIDTNFPEKHGVLDS